MKAVKKGSALLLVLIFSVMLAACGSAPSDGNTTRSQTAAAAKATEALPAEPSEHATQAAETKAGSGNWLEGARLSSSSDIEGWVNGYSL